MPTFLEILKAANESRNKQRHRIVADTKQGRQHIARTSQNDSKTGDKTTSEQTERGSTAREPEQGVISKRHI